MLTDQDVRKLIKAFSEVFPTREEVVTKDDLAELRADFNVLQTAVDGISKKFDVFQTELLTSNHRITKLEKHTGLI